MRLSTFGLCLVLLIAASPSVNPAAADVDGQVVAITDYAADRQPVAISLAPNPETGEVAIVWSEQERFLNVVAATRIYSSVVRPGSDGAYAATKPRRVSKRSELSTHWPRIAYNPVKREYLAVYSQYRNSETEFLVKARRVNSGGKPFGRTVVSTPEDTNSRLPALHFLQDEAARAPGSRFLLLFNRSFGADTVRSGLFSRVVDDKGRPVDDVVTKISTPFLRSPTECGSNAVYDFFQRDDGSFVLSETKSDSRGPLPYSVTLDSGGGVVEEERLATRRGQLTRIHQLSSGEYVWGRVGPNAQFSGGPLKDDLTPRGKEKRYFKSARVSQAVFVGMEGVPESYVVGGNALSYPQGIVVRSISATGSLGEERQVHTVVPSSLRALLDAVAIPGTDKILVVFGEYSPGLQGIPEGYRIAAFIFEPAG